MAHSVFEGDSFMPGKNLYHNAVIQALTIEGWRITHDPLTISYGGKDLYVDLGAERVTIAAEKDEQKIAVEIQSFLSPSPVRDLEEAVGQYEIYRSILTETPRPTAIPGRAPTCLRRHLCRTLRPAHCYSSSSTTARV